MPEFICCGDQVSFGHVLSCDLTWYSHMILITCSQVVTGWQMLLEGGGSPSLRHDVTGSIHTV